MNLRDLKRTSRAVSLAPALGDWAHYGGGELVRCPAPDCGRGWIEAFPNTEFWVRVAGLKGEPCQRAGTGVGGWYDCRDTRCPYRLEVEVRPA